jgi:hypothetical protein
MASNDQYSELKESLEQAHKQNKEMLTQINATLENKAKDTNLATRLLVKEIIQEEPNKIIPKIIQGILEKIKAGMAISIKEMKSVQVQTTKSVNKLVIVLTDPTVTTASTASKSTDNNQEGSSSDESNDNKQDSTANENNILTQDNSEQEDTANDQVAAQNRKLMSQETKDRKRNILTMRRSPWTQVGNTSSGKPLSDKETKEKE